MEEGTAIVLGIYVRFFFFLLLCVMRRYGDERDYGGGADPTDHDVPGERAPVRHRPL